jgi:predicted  nucleic acid-binding Zn-ribbon protein
MKESEILQTLVELQKVDRAILDVEHEKTTLREEIKGFKDRIAAKRAEAASKKSKFEETRKKRVSIEMEIKTKEAEIKTKNGQSVGIKTNEAFKALQREIDTIKSDIRKLEDAIIVFMEDEEAASAFFKKQEKEDKEEENVLLGRVKELEEQEKTRDSVIAGYMEKRGGVAAAVDKNWYEKYERIRKNKGLALAAIIENGDGSGACGGCKFTVRPQTVIELRKNTAIRTCENCARIWYLEPKQETAK